MEGGPAEKIHSSERKDTTELYEMKEQYAFRGQHYFLVAVVQNGPRSDFWPFEEIPRRRIASPILFP
jgi:hypothetical protein